MNAINTIKKRNDSHIYAADQRKSFVRKASAYHIGRKDFNPRPAKYRSNRGLAFQKKELITSVALQVLPIALLAALLIAKYVI